MKEIGIIAHASVNQYSVQRNVGRGIRCERQRFTRAGISADYQWKRNRAVSNDRWQSQIKATPRM